VSRSNFSLMLYPLSSSSMRTGLVLERRKVHGRVLIYIYMAQKNDVAAFLYGSSYNISYNANPGP
jgi:hypothetical protein